LLFDNLIRGFSGILHPPWNWGAEAANRPPAPLHEVQRQQSDFANWCRQNDRTLISCGACCCHRTARGFRKDHFDKMLAATQPDAARKLRAHRAHLLAISREPRTLGRPQRHQELRGTQKNNPATRTYRAYRALFSHFPDRISCHAALDEAASAPFRKERRMKFAKATKFHRKSGGEP
jgi:hypothetical protein